MPGLDRTGPEGQGSQTGRGLGKCNPNNKNAQTKNNEENTTLAARPRLGNGRNDDQYFAGGRGPGSGRGRSRGRGLGKRFRGGQQ